MDSFEQPITTVNLKLLQTFMLVAEHSSFRQAADQAHRSASAITAQIKQLEAQVGAPLFYRTTRRVRLTAEGEQLFSSARRAVQELGSGLRKVYESVDIRRGRISFACLPTIAATRLAPILSSFERDYPEVRIFVHELHSHELCEKIRSGEVDFGVGTATQDADLHLDLLQNDDLVALVPKRLIGRPRSAITLTELAVMPVLLLNSTCSLRRLLEDAMRTRDLVLRTKYQFMQMQTLISMAEAGLGAAILPRSAVPPETAASVQVVEIVEPTITRQIAIIRMQGQTLSPAAGRLVQLLRALFKAPAGQQEAPIGSPAAAIYPCARANLPEPARRYG